MATSEATSEIAEGIHRCGSRHVNWYLIEGNDTFMIVNKNFPTHWQELADRLDALNYGLADLEVCLLTHAHPDHNQ